MRLGEARTLCMSVYWPGSDRPVDELEQAIAESDEIIAESPECSATFIGGDLNIAFGAAAADGITFGGACEAAHDVDPELDFAACIERHVALGTLADFRT